MAFFERRKRETEGEDFDFSCWDSVQLNLLSHRVDYYTSEPAATVAHIVCLIWMLEQKILNRNGKRREKWILLSTYSMGRLHFCIFIIYLMEVTNVCLSVRMRITEETLTENGTKYFHKKINVPSFAVFSSSFSWFLWASCLCICYFNSQSVWYINNNNDDSEWRMASDGVEKQHIPVGNERMAQGTTIATIMCIYMNYKRKIIYIQCKLRIERRLWSS